MTQQTEYLTAWAEPTAVEFYGRAFSEEHAQKLATAVGENRQRFLINALRQRLNGDEPLPAATTTPDFSAIPARSVIDRDDHLRLAIDPGQTDPTYTVTITHGS